MRRSNFDSRTIQANAHSPKAIQPNHRTPVLSPFPPRQSVFSFDRQALPLSSVRLLLRHSRFPSVSLAPPSSFRRKPESRGQQRQPPWGNVRRCAGVTSGDPPPEGEGILLSVGKRADAIILEPALTSSTRLGADSLSNLAPDSLVCHSFRPIPSPSGRGLESAPDLIRGRGSPEVISNARCLLQRGAALPGFRLPPE